MATKQEAAQTRERLLAAARQTIRGRGITGLTLDAVAKEAGVSKGGLLHHFPSKEALVEGILKHLFEVFEARVQHYFELEAPAPGRWLRAYVRANFADDPLPLEWGTIVMIAMTENPALLARVQEDYQQWEARLLADGVPRARALVIRQAADAFWLDQSIRTSREDAADRQAVMNELLKLTEMDAR
jgi:AcrR family transcriptional regulator